MAGRLWRCPDPDLPAPSYFVIGFDEHRLPLLAVALVGMVDYSAGGGSASSAASSRSRMWRMPSHSSFVTITSRAWLPLYSPTMPAAYIWSIRREARP